MQLAARDSALYHLIKLLAICIISGSASSDTANPMRVSGAGIMSFPQTLLAGENISVVLTNAPGHSIDEWVGVFVADTNELLFWDETEGIVNGRIDFQNSISNPGIYEARYYLENSPKAIEKIPLTILPGTEFTIEPSKQYFRADESVSANITNSPANAKDWIGLYHADDTNNRNYLFWVYTNSLSSGTQSLGKPAPEPGTYELRYFLNNSYQLVGKTTLRVVQKRTHRIELAKNSFTVNENISLTVPHPPGNVKDWVGIYLSGEPDDRKYLTWQYLPTDENLPVTMAGLTGIGSYEARLFYNNTYKRISSAPFEVLPENIREATVALIGDISWIEPQVFELLNSATWPTAVTASVAINSQNEIVSAYDVLENMSLPVNIINGIYQVTVPPFSFTKFITLQYLDATNAPDHSELPDWSTSSLINGYTALSPAYYYKPEVYGDGFDNAELVFNSMGFNKYTRMAKAHTKLFSTMWPSPSIVNAAGESIYTEIEDSVLLMGERAYENDLDFIAYYKDMGDSEILKVHPEWECKTPEGMPTEEIFTMLDFSSPWKEVVLAQLLELAERGAKGAYFDYVHSPHWGCYGSTMQQLFESETGLTTPSTNAQGHHWSNHENWIPYIEFQATKTTEAFIYWKDEVRKQYPDFIFLVAGGFVSGLTSAIQGFSTVEASDMVKVEFDHGRSAGLRHRVFEKDLESDNNLAKPSENILLLLAHLVPANFSVGEKFHSWAYGFTNTDQLKGFISSTIAMGGIPDIFVPEQYLRSDFSPESYIPRFASQTPYDSLLSSIDFGRTISNSLKKKNAIKFAGVYFDESNKNAYHTDYEAAWRHVIWPSVGAYESFLRAGVPVTALTERSIFRHIDSLKLIYIPVARSLLTSTVQQLLTDFESRGGTVIDRDQQIAWDTPAGNTSAYAQFAAKIELHRQNSDFWVTQDSDNTSPIVYPFFYR